MAQAITTSCLCTLSEGIEAMNGTALRYHRRLSLPRSMRVLIWIFPNQIMSHNRAPSLSIEIAVSWPGHYFVGTCRYYATQNWSIIMNTSNLRQMNLTRNCPDLQRDHRSIYRSLHPMKHHYVPASHSSICKKIPPSLYTYPMFCKLS